MSQVDNKKEKPTLTVQEEENYFGRRINFGVDDGMSLRIVLCTDGLTQSYPEFQN